VVGNGGGCRLGGGLPWRTRPRRAVSENYDSGSDGGANDNDAEDREEKAATLLWSRASGR
jgi:hypothetical protein